MIYRNRHSYLIATIKAIGKITIMQYIQNLTDAFFCVVLNMSHIGMHSLKPKLCRDFL